MNEGRTCRNGRRQHVANGVPAVMQSVALEQLQAIRQTMADSAQFTAVPGRGLMLIGATALVAAWAATHQKHWFSGWMRVWLAEAAVAIVIAAVAMVRKGKRLGLPIASGPGRKVLLAVVPTLAAGALITLALWGSDAATPKLIPGTWLLLYGAAVIGAGANSVKPVPLMGACFVVLGAVTLFAPFNLMNISMVSGFGVLHVAFGWWIAKEYGG